MKAKTVWRDLYETPRYVEYWTYKNLIVITTDCDFRWLNCFGKIPGALHLTGGGKLIGDSDD